MVEDRDTVVKIMDIFEESIIKRKYEDFCITFENFDRCIKVSNSKNVIDDNDLIFLWIRLIKRNNRYSVDISNITLPKSIRRKGIMTDIISKLNRLKDDVFEIRISGVCTEGMFLFCKKMNMDTYNNMDYFMTV